MEALLAANSQGDGYDIAILDMMMPIREEEAREDSNADHSIIIALTAHAMEGSREHFLAAGMDDYLSKPFNMQQLKETLNRWLPERLPEEQLPACFEPSGAKKPVEPATHLSQMQSRDSS